MPQSLETNLAGQPLRFYASGAVYSIEHRTLFVADTHLGKEATFRSNGLPIPVGSTDKTLGKISSLITETQPHRVVVLGDLYHAWSSLAEDVLESLKRFFDSHVGLRLTVVRGNHDQQIDRLARSWPIDVVEPGYRIGELRLSHEPMTLCEGSRIVLCGHLHPALSVGHISDRLGKLPCFWYSQDRLVLPAIGDFTGTQVVPHHAGDQAWIVVGDEVVPYGQPL